MLSVLCAPQESIVKTMLIMLTVNINLSKIMYKFVGRGKALKFCNQYTYDMESKTKTVYS